MAGQLDFDARLDLLPVRFLQQFALELPQLAFGGPDDIQRAALPQIVQIVLAGHAPVHRPDPFGPAVLRLHQIDDVFHGGDVGPVPAKTS